MYTIIGSPRSRAQRVYWAMEEMGMDYQSEPVAPRSEMALAHNPSGKVPCFIVDGETITDSVAIIQYLADKHDKLTFPAGSIARAKQDSFTQFCGDEVDGALWAAAKHTFALPEAHRIKGMKDTAKYEFARAMKTLETRLGSSEFVMGDRMTVPDIILGQCGFWAGVAKFDIPEGPVSDYFQRLLNRPAFVKVMAWADSLPSVIKK